MTAAAAAQAAAKPGTTPCAAMAAAAMAAAMAERAPFTLAPAPRIPPRPPLRTTTSQVDDFSNERAK